jgi:hypothetical protein
MVCRNMIWRVGGLIYRYTPLTGKSLPTVGVRTPRLLDTTLIVPPRQDDRLRQVLAPILGVRLPIILCIDSFASWHTLFASLDLGWPRKRTMIELFKAYNKRAVQGHSSESILIEMPIGSE